MAHERIQWECADMARWQIELQNVGRTRAAGKVLVDAENLVKAKQQAMRICRRHLSAGGDIYLEARGRHRYSIVLGMDYVGEATITCLEATRRARR